MKNDQVSPQSRAFSDKTAKYIQFQFPGLVKYQKELFTRFTRILKKQDLQEATSALADSVSTIESELRRLGITHHELLPASEAAYLNLRGLLDMIQGSNGTYSIIYAAVRAEKNKFKRLNNRELVLEISSSLRVSHLIKWDKHTIWFRTSLPALSLPSDYFSAVAYMLFSRLLKKPVAEKIRQKILQYENQLKTGKSYFPARRLPYGAHKGRYIDLAAIFNEINRSYFNDELKRPTLAWSRKKGKRRLGFYDGLHHRIIINPLLDNPDIPGFVIRGIVYHEILHIIHPVVNKNGRRIIHSPIFKNDERKFADHLKLERWLKEDFPKLLRNRKQTGKIC